MSTKDIVIAALENQKGSFISGEALAKQCNVSRNAIWKSVSDLKKMGFKIESVNNKGYRLSMDSDVISEAGILRYMDEQLQISVTVLDEVDSTNREAKRTLLFSPDKVCHGTLIVAKHQTAGRGHGGSDFSSPDGGVYFSLILEPQKLHISAEKLKSTVRTGIKKVMEELYESTFTLKEDSSLWLGNQKVSGVLTEGIVDLETGIFSSYIVGIGIRTDVLKEVCEPFVEKNRLIASLGTVLLSS